MNFSDYLKSKKIDEAAFEKAEPVMFSQWRQEFTLMHPNSFTVQKLNLINPIRRRFTLKVISGDPKIADVTVPKPLSTAVPKIPKPVFKTKPKAE